MMTQLVKKDLNGYRCINLYRDLPKGGIFSLGEIYPPHTNGAKFRLNYRGLSGEFDTLNAATSYCEGMEKERDKSGAAPNVFPYNPE